MIVNHRSHHSLEGYCYAFDHANIAAILMSDPKISKTKGDYKTEIFILSLRQHLLLNLEDPQPSLGSHVRHVETLPTRIHLWGPSKAPISDFDSPLSSALWRRQ